MGIEVNTDRNCYLVRFVGIELFAGCPFLGVRERPRSFFSPRSLLSFLARTRGVGADGFTVVFYGLEVF